MDDGKRASFMPHLGFGDWQYLDWGMRMVPEADGGRVPSGKVPMGSGVAIGSVALAMSSWRATIRLCLVELPQIVETLRLCAARTRP